MNTGALALLIPILAIVGGYVVAIMKIRNKQGVSTREQVAENQAFQTELAIYGPIRFARHSIAILRRVHCTHIFGLLLRYSSGPDGYLLLLSLSSLRLRNEPMPP